MLFVGFQFSWLIQRFQSSISHPVFQKVLYQLIHRVFSKASAGRLSPPDLHDARSRCGCRQPQQRLSCAQCRRTAAALERQGVTGFVQPLHPHEHWHIDVSYVNLCATFYSLCSILDGCSRYIVHWERRETMTEKDVEIILQRAREFIRVAGMPHVRKSPFYPQSNGKPESYKTIKTEDIRPKVALLLDEVRTQMPITGEAFNSLTQQG